MTLTAKLWELLDEATDKFMGIPKEERDTPEALKAAGEARGLSKAIHVMCQPHYEDSTAVAKQAIKRLRAREKGHDVPLTPGDMSDVDSQAAVVNKETEAKRSGKAAPKKSAPAKAKPAESAPADGPEGDEAREDRIKKEVASLTEQQIKQVVNGLRCNFEPSKLAELYKVSPEAIERVGDEAKK